jgi:PKD repeat protein
MSMIMRNNLQKRRKRRTGTPLLIMTVLLAILATFSAQTSSAQCKLEGKFKFEVKGNDVYFKDVTAGTHAVYKWVFGDGHEARTVTSTKHTYKKPGVYRACLIVYTRSTTSNIRCIDTVCQKVVVKRHCNIKADFTYRKSGRKAAFFARSNGTYYKWNFGDGAVGFGKSIRHKYRKDGVYKVCLTVYSKDRKCKRTICKRIVIKTPCKVQANFVHRTSGKNVYLFAKRQRHAKYVWNFGDGTRGTGVRVKHSYKKPGIYVVCLKVYSRTGRCFKTFCKRIVIKDPCRHLKADFNFKTDGKLVSFKSRTNGSYTLWDFGDGHKSRDANVRHKYYRAGVYKVCLTVWSKNKKCKVTVCKRVIVKDPCSRLKADFAYRVDGKYAKFESKSRNAAYFLWDFGDGNTSRGKYGLHQYTSAGIYNVCLTVWTKDKKCKLKICKRVKVEKPCDLKADFRMNVDGNTVKFESNSNIGHYYKWDFGDGTGSRDKNISHRYSRKGVYVVCLTVWDCTKRCSVRICKRVEIKDSCNLKAEISCTVDGNTVKFMSRTNTGKYFKWSFGDGTYSRDQNVKHTYKHAGEYKVCLTVVDSLEKCRITICKKVVIKRRCNTTAKFSVTKDGNLVKFENLSTNYKYLSWKFGDGTGSRTNGDVKHTYLRKGKYRVCLIAIDSLEKCRDTFCMEISIDTTTRRSGSTTNTVNSGSSKDEWNIYPNPVNTTLTVSHTMRNAATLVLRDVTGKVVMSVEVNENTSVTNIDVESLTEGMYYLNVHTSDGTVTKKFMKL